MKFSQWSLFFVIMLSCAACRRDKAADVVAPTAPPPAAVNADLPTDAEIANFIAAWQDPDDANKSIRFDVTFGTASLMPQVMDEFRERGKIPFTVSVNFYRMEVEPMRNPWGGRGRSLNGVDEDVRAEKLGWFNDMDAQPQLVRVLQMVNIYSIMDGQAEIAVLDEDGKIVDRVRKDLALLCPS